MTSQKHIDFATHPIPGQLPKFVYVYMFLSLKLGKSKRGSQMGDFNPGKSGLFGADWALSRAYRGLFGADRAQFLRTSQRQGRAEIAFFGPIGAFRAKPPFAKPPFGFL